MTNKEKITITNTAASYSFNPQLALGFHLDFNDSSSDANALEYDATSFAFSVNGNYLLFHQ